MFSPKDFEFFVVNSVEKEFFFVFFILLKKPSKPYIYSISRIDIIQRRNKCVRHVRIKIFCDISGFIRYSPFITDGNEGQRNTRGRRIEENMDGRF